MPRVIFIACLTLAFLRPVLGDEPPPPPLTPITLRGIWEGVSAGSVMVFQFAVEPDGRGCLVFFRGFRPAIYRLVSAKVVGGNVTLRFENTQASDGDYHYARYVTIRGSGRGDSEIGILSGKIEGSPRDGGSWIDTQMSFSRPPWLKYAARASQPARRLLEKARRAIPPKA